MLPQINGKSFLSCNEEDLLVLVDNVDYRENEYIDYKRNFAFLEEPKGKVRDTKKAEFRSDVCAFANSDGGYLIYGISDKNGCASTIEGIEIEKNDTDRFELDRRNDLNSIQPKIPQISFSFIQLKSGKYVVIMYVQHDGFAPYIHLEEEKNYLIHRRYGNGKRVVPYTELRLMFNQSLTLEQSILDYTKNRIQYYRELSGSFGDRFIHMMIIPETFMDYSFRQNMFVLEKTGEASFGEIFSSISCNNPSIPCVDGLRYVPYHDRNIQSEGYVRNSGVVEACLSLMNQLDSNQLKYKNGFLPWEWIWNIIRPICYQYTRVFNTINTGNRAFICISIVGCRDVVTEDRGFISDYTGKIDRDTVICEPVEILKSADDNEFGKVMNELYMTFMLAIGIKYDDKLKKIITELYER